MTCAAVRPDEDVIRDADGEILREHDDVILLETIPQESEGNTSVENVASNTSATIIMICSDFDSPAWLECYVGPQQFVFAFARGEQLRLLRRREEILKHAGH